MNTTETLQLVGIYRPRQHGPGFGIPVFADDAGYRVQEIASEGHVIRFVPCDIEPHNLRVWPSPTVLTLQRAGEQALYAFETTDGTIQVGRREKVVEWLRHKVGGLQTTPFVLRDVAEFLEDADLLREANKRCAALMQRSNKTPLITSSSQFRPGRILRSSSMASSPPPSAIEVFYSYSHKDEILRDTLETHLSLLKHQGVIANWHDRGIPAGTEWAGAIDAHLQSAQIVLLLISADFLASNYCYKIEMQRAMERHESGEACVIPIILRPVDWHSALFGKLQALPKDGKAITTWPNQDEAFLDVAQGIRKVAEGLTKERKKKSSDGRRKFRAHITNTVASKLKTLTDENLIRKIAAEMQQIAGEETSSIDLDANHDVLVRQIATCVVEHGAVTDVVGCFLYLIQDLPLETANKLADIVDYLLPLNYAPDVLDRLHAQVTAEHFGLVEDTVATSTLAEIIMAGYDQKSAKFVTLPNKRSRWHGQTALPYHQVPEEGPVDSSSEAASLPRAVRNFLYDLLALLGRMPDRARESHEDAHVQQDIANYAVRLQGLLQGKSKTHRRSMYCVLKLPTEALQRDFNKRLLREICDKLSQEGAALIFVELVSDPTDPREFEVEEFIDHIQNNIRARYLRTQ